MTRIREVLLIAVVLAFAVVSIRLLGQQVTPVVTVPAPQTEDLIIAWFAAHQLTHALAVAVVGAVSASIRSDRSALAKERETNPTAEFSWKVALVHYAKGAVAAAAAVLGAKIFHVLGMV